MGTNQGAFSKRRDMALVTSEYQLDELRRVLARERLRRLRSVGFVPVVADADVYYEGHVEGGGADHAEPDAVAK